MSLAERLRSERERLALTQPQFAELTGVGKNTVISWEKGGTSPTAVQLSELSKAGLDVLYVVMGQRFGGAPALTLEEEKLLSHFRSTSNEVRCAVLGALVAVHMPRAIDPAISGHREP